MRPIESPDEISYHMIEAAHAALKLQRGSILEPSTPAPKRQPAELSSQVSPPKDSSYNSGAAPLAAVATPMQMSASAPTKPQFEGLELRKAIASFVQKKGEGSEEGVALATISSHFLPTSG